ncbi:HipA family kinase [Terribacillus sp. 7520-G]|uniref:HipA family kinase n=1 Tax=Terribacillus sp. 7520-G TaxID=2025389 RepID=UPI000BA7A7D1|nr:HipA family kinase [Terribacillus sp. 7520-G]PAD39832.1 hypothetical protein CHH53_04110 [Terribacillus sp. 7520-G]
MGGIIIKQINVQSFLNYLGTGMSRPAIIVGDDFEKYILKTQRTAQDNWNCMFLNEGICYKIACYLGVPVPEAAIANLDQKLIDADPEITFVHRFFEGLHFASSELTGKEENLLDNHQMAMKMGRPYLAKTWNAFFDNIVNAEDISKIIAFDLLVGNFDRYGNEGNLLISNESAQRKIFAIDHGHAFFGPKWTSSKVQKIKEVNDPNYRDNFAALILKNNNGRMDGLGTVFRAIENRVDLSDIDNHSFMEVVSRIESINSDMLIEWFNEIPDAWYVDKGNQIGIYSQFILRQKLHVRHLIQEMARYGAFTNYRGGVLNWNRTQSTGTV